MGFPSIKSNHSLAAQDVRKPDEIQSSRSGGNTSCGFGCSFLYSPEYVKSCLERALAGIEPIVEKHTFDGASRDDLTQISLALLRAERALRKPFDDADSLPSMAKTQFDGVLSDDICMVERPENALLRICLPVVLGRSRGEWYSARKRAASPSDTALLDKEIYHIVKQALLTDIQKHGPIDVPNESLFLLFKRHLPDKTQPRSIAFVDSNNVETGYITNAICEVLGKSDNYKNMGFAYFAVEDREPYFEVILCRKTNIENWISEYKAEP